MKALTALCSLLLAALFISATSAGDKPNVILIYGDDVGFADIGANGSKLIPTPHIDRLAAEGLNFIDGHCPAATCSASRYTMLTGELAWRKGIAILGPTSAMPILRETYTLPRVFKDAGYATAVIGKWHLGLGTEGIPVDWNGEVKPGPLEIGFDYSFLLPNTNDRVPCVYLENYRVPNLDPDDPITIGERIDPRQTAYPDGRETPEAMTYYMNSHGHNHSVINGIGRIGTMFGGKSALWNDETMGDVFLEKTEAWMDQHLEKNAEQPFFMFLPSQMIHVPRTPHPRYHGKTGLGYRGDAMVELDDSVGTIMKMLEKHGISDDTMVIFSSDNGPVYDDGYQDGTVVKTSSQEVDQGHDGSGPYRGGKYQIYEGGTRVPFIIRWPAKIKPGTSEALVSHTDFMASFAQLFGQSIPDGAAPDSQDTMSALIGEDTVGNEYMIEETRNNLALRNGDWKLIMTKPRPKKKKAKKGNNAPVAATPKFELYHLGDDIAETTNVAEKHPKRFEAMQKMILSISEGESVRSVVGAK